ncbi:probable aspartyl protease At4g16563 [Aristolochia californica]|uniref:probable aspartyl protease At4g16563 n=1 Tax=Aristolochia californica TaxID=171875 RepID=UPI0035E2E187
MASTVFLGFLSLLFVKTLSDETASITLPLHQFPVSPSPSQWRQTLAGIASFSLSRARHLKSPRIAPVPLYPHSYGGYSVSLDFGTPPQRTSLLIDTGSHLVWIPCTRNYFCRNCSFLGNNHITPFIPKSSSSSKIIGCKNPKCGWIHSPEFLSGCRSCSSGNCTQICPPYFVLYGSGSTGGILLSETLRLPEKGITNFAIGCSLVSSRQPAGIAGLGRGSPSLPAQLGVKRFSYCLVSHRLDDDPRAASSLVLDGEHKNLSYTPLVKNPATGKPSFSVFYYVALRKVSVGGKSVKIPYERLRLGPDGNGGTIVDSGTTFTYMAGDVFDLVAREFETQVAGTYRRATDVESDTGLRPCFQLPAEKKSQVGLPELTFHFKGGAKMRLPLANYFSFLGDSVICLTIVSDGVEGSLQSDGPSVILGNFQQQNYLIEYDLEKERFGFREQRC